MRQEDGTEMGYAVRFIGGEVNMSKVEWVIFLFYTIF